MEESMKKKHVEGGGEREILYSKAIKAGKRIYYLDVKRNLKDDLFIAVTESKKVQAKDSPRILFEKHKIFLYKEDFEKFMEGMRDVIDFIKNSGVKEPERENVEMERRGEQEENVEELSSDDIKDIKLDIEF